MVNLQRPTLSQLENIEANIRLYYAKKGKTPHLVKLAGENPIVVSAAWQNEAVRLWYLCLRHGVDPLEMETHVDALDSINWETF